jgi:hypothetical protein
VNVVTTPIIEIPLMSQFDEGSDFFIVNDNPFMGCYDILSFVIFYNAWPIGLSFLKFNVLKVSVGVLPPKTC